MKTKAKKLLCLLLCALFLCSVLVLPISASGTGSQAGSSTNSTMTDISQILNTGSYAEYKKTHSDKNAGSATIVIDANAYDDYKYVGDAPSIGITPNYQGDQYLEGTQSSSALYVPEKGTVSWTFDVPAGSQGLYVIELEYHQVGKKTNSIERIFYIDGDVPFSEARSIVLSKLWKYQYKEGSDNPDTNIVEGTFNTDKQGNDVRPTVIQDKGWQKYQIADSNGYEVYPFQFYFSEGTHTISFESQREAMLLKSITLKPLTKAISYADYIAKYGPIAENKVTEQQIKDALKGNGTIKVEAEAPKNVSAVTMYPVYDRTSPITSGVTGSQSHIYTKYNTAGKEQWQTVGEWMSYIIDVPVSGYYSIAVRYKQALLSGMSVTRKVYIDGQIPFDEANNCQFPYADSWNTIFLGDENQEFVFYLEAGEHEIKLEAALGEKMGEQIQKVSNALSVINNAYLQILRLTGSDPDTSRDYDFSRVMPGVMRDLFDQYVVLKGVYNVITNNGKDKGEMSATIEQVYILLEKMAKDESTIPGNLQTLKSQIGSLGTWVNSVKSQPLQVDFYSVQSSDTKLPRAEANFFESLWYEIKLFFASFVVDYNSIGGDSDSASDNKVEVWVVTGRDQAQIIRNLIDNNFPYSDVGVSLKLVSAGTLLPSVLAGRGPDVSLMEASTTIIDYALRDAVLPLNEHIEKDGGEVLTYFPDAAMIPLTLHDYDMYGDETKKTYYGLPDSLTFPMLFYRKDVLSSLKLEIPNTWDDMLSILPVLQFNNMEIGIQNDIYTFIAQSNNEVYSNHGMTINFDNIGVLNAFTKMCNMYTQYSLPYTYDFANRFRTGEMPIGIAPYTTCNQLAVFASELSGLWTFYQMPGYEYTRTVVTDRGTETIKTYNRDSVATVTGCVMLRGCEEDNRENAWKFMKWYVGKDFQVDYSNEIVSIMGIASRPATANTEAIKELPWTAEEATNILSQFNNLTAVENHPGSYYLARYISFAFLAAYNEGSDPADALLDYVNTINDEINRRRKEFQNRDPKAGEEERFMFTVDEYEEYLLSDKYQEFLTSIKGNQAKYDAHLLSSTYEDFLRVLDEKDLAKYAAHIETDIYAHYLELLASSAN